MLGLVDARDENPDVPMDDQSEVDAARDSEIARRVEEIREGKAKLILLDEVRTNLEAIIRRVQTVSLEPIVTLRGISIELLAIVAQQKSESCFQCACSGRRPSVYSPGPGRLRFGTAHVTRKFYPG
jgi:hypothetical protein